MIRRNTQVRSAADQKDKAHEWVYILFDPSKPGRMYASVHEDALYVSDDYGRTWRKDGLEGSAVYRMKFVPEKSR